MNIDIEALRGLVKIAELGTVTKAAEALLIAQPALSRKIGQLEKELQQPLFVHAGRYLQLTSFGHQVVCRARAVLQNLDSLQNLKDEYESRPVIRIGASLTTLGGFLPKTVAHFRKTQPGVDLIIRTGLSEEIYDLVANGSVEIGIVSSPPGFAPGSPHHHDRKGYLAAGFGHHFCRVQRGDENMHGN